MARRHSITRGPFAYHFKAFPADTCLDRFADVQAKVLGNLFVDFGNGDGSGNISPAQKLEAAITGLTSFSSTMTGKTTKFLRETILDPAYTYVTKEDNAPVALTSDNMERLDVPAGDLGIVLIEGFKFQFGDLFTTALSHFGLDLSQIKAGSLLESFKTGLKGTAVSGDFGSPTN